MRLLLATVLLTLVVTGCGGQGTAEGDATEPASPRATTPAQTETTSDETSDPGSDRTPAPPIEGETLDGDALSLADLRGRPVLVNVWSSW